MTAKGDRAKELLNDPTFQKALTDVRQAILQGFTDCDVGDEKTPHRFRLYLHLLDSVEANLIKAIEDGELEDFNASKPYEGVV